MTEASKKLKEGELSPGRVALLTAQVNVNRAVSLLNTSLYGQHTTVLFPVDYSDEAIDAKILLAIDDLERALVCPRGHKGRARA